MGKGALRRAFALVVALAGWFLAVVAPAQASRPVEPQRGDWTCVPEGRPCTFGSDCCSKHCVNDPKLGKVCKKPGASWTCVPEGRECTFGSDCCSKRCVNDPRLGKVCKPTSS